MNILKLTFIGKQSQVRHAITRGGAIYNTLVADWQLSTTLLPPKAKEASGISVFCIGIQDSGVTDTLRDSDIQAQSLQKLTDLART